MREYRLFLLALSLALMLLLPSLPVARADDTATSIVDATITATYESGTSLHVTARMLVHQINDIFSDTYTQDQIEHNATSDDIVAIKLRLRDSLNHQLQTSFPDTQITPIGRPVYTIPYFTDEFTVNLTDAFFDAAPTINITTLVAGMLDSGADITYHYHLTSENGWNTTYLFTLPDTLQLRTASTENVTADHRQITWTVPNTNGTTPPTTATLALHATTPTTPPNTPERLTIDFALDTRTPASVSLTAHIQIHTLDLTAYHALPAFITGTTTIPADGLRLLADNHLLTYETIHNTTIQPLLDRLQPLLEASPFNQTLAFTFSWDQTTTTNCTPPYNTTHMDTEPAVTAQYRDPAVRLTIGTLTARAYFGLVNAGATATLTPTDLNFGIGLTSLGLPYTITLQLPQNITLDNQTTVHWNQTTTATGTLHSDVSPQPPYTMEKRSATIQIDLTKMDLNLPSLFTGKTELIATTTLTEDDALFILHTPPLIHLPSTMTLPYLNADAYRLCTEEGLLTPATQNDILASQQTAFESRLSTIFNGRTIKTLTNTKAYTNSLQWNGDIATMDDLVPIILATTADDATSVAASISLSPATFTIAPLHFTLPHLANTTTTYRLVFPPGQTLTTVDAAGQPYTKGTTSDDRAYVEFLFNDTNASMTTPVTCFLSVSPLYVLVLFLPLILVVVLLVILVIIILLIRKRRKGIPRQPRKKSKAKKEESEEPSGSEEAEDFYVPPPPSSRRR